MKTVKGASTRYLWAALALAMPACGGDPYAVATAHASGVVLVDGKPLADGNIVFQPVTEGHRPASGVVKDGKFTLSTYKDGDGAAPGKHKVAVIASKEVPTKDGDVEIEYLVPRHVTSPETSGIEITLPPSGTDKIEILITRNNR